MKFISYVLTEGLNIILITPALSYEVITVSNGGNISGRVTLAGTNPRHWRTVWLPIPTRTFAGVFPQEQDGVS
ncbi:MAG: hypothetical protein H0X47_05570 [Nitrospirales bacterium]|nr:hypothetical protein [Nitrospirales bacterium]